VHFAVSAKSTRHLFNQLKLGCWTLLATFFLVACQPAPVAQVPTAMPTLIPTAPPSPTPTSAPPTATPTALPTATATSTPAPTATPPQPTPTPQPLGPGGLPYPLKTEALEFGVAAHLFYIGKSLPLRRADEAGFGWIRHQIHWKDLEGPAGRYVWGELDSVVEAVQRANLKLMLSVVRSPSFYTTNGGTGMPKDPRRLGNFLAALTKHYRGKVQAIEIWNEQNLAHENGGRVSIEDAGHYVELLKEAYTRIKAVDPSVYVLAGPPSSTGITKASVAIDDMTYYEAMYSYDGGVIGDYFDAQAVHPGGAANPPETIWPDNPSNARGWTDHPTFYFRHVEDVRALMERHGLGNHQIWITEYGWATPNRSPGFEYGNQTSLEEQADYIVGAMRLAAMSGANSIAS
jgi:polysaccharide biosynthesis protein PslG